MSWQVAHLAGSAQELHNREVVGERRVTICDVDAPAVVLGSTQAAPEVSQTDLPFVRRRSGGGAVLVRPGDPLWVDVDLPKDDPLWLDDVSRSFWWLGETWVRALATLGFAAEVHRGAQVCGLWCKPVCFGGIGSGEVTIDGRKVVGVSQRRTRAGARFHCAALLSWDPAPLVAAMGLPPEAMTELSQVAAAIPTDAAALERAFLDALPK